MAAGRLTATNPLSLFRRVTFEHAKSEMEIALGKYVEGLLREAPDSSHGQAA